MNWQKALKTIAPIVGFFFLLAAPLPAISADAWYPFPVEVWEPAFDSESPRRNVDYIPLESVTKKWRICVSFPHVKDDYWLAVNFGIAEEARRLGIVMELYEAGGYENLDRQISQIRDCLANKPDGVIISAISGHGLNELVAEVTAAGLPVVDLVNGMNSDSLAARSAVFFGDMGFMAGRYIVETASGTSETVRVAWFPGPKDAAWVQAGDAGFRKAISGSTVQIVESRFGDTGKSAQAKLIKEVLDRNSEIDFIVGTAVTAEAAIRILRKRKLNKKIKIMAYYYGPGIHRGIRRGTILAAPTDLPAIQGRIAIDQVVRILERKPVLKHVGPVIQVVDGAGQKEFDSSTSLAPTGFRVVYNVN